MCVDFTDLEKACPKNNYPFPRIDLLVNSSTGHQLLSFMDTFSKYNQIKLDEADQEKTSFVMSQWLFCYKVMLFGLKNVGAMYQRLMNKMFAQQIRRNVEVYVDNMLVKSTWKLAISTTFGKHLIPFASTIWSLTLVSICSAWRQGSSWALWCHSTGWKLIPTRFEL